MSGHLLCLPSEIMSVWDAGDLPSRLHPTLKNWTEIVALRPTETCVDSI